MSKNTNYNKYLKYKKKYLELKQNMQDGGDILSDEQIYFHNYLKTMDNESYISGFCGVYQWVNNNPDSKMPRTVTIIGEYHENYYDFKDCLIRTIPGGIEMERPNQPIIEVLYNLLKGTRNCIDFVNSSSFI